MTEPSDVDHEPPGLPPDYELRFRYSRSGGPGGQHVNTSSTRVEAIWDLTSSTAITDEQRALLAERLAHRVDSEGNLHVVSSYSRSQHDNRREAAERMRALVAGALEPRKERRPTKPSRSAREHRLEGKRRRGQRKQQRKPVDW